MVEKANIDIATMILAGGEARRLGGGDKCLLPLAGKPILSHILERLGKGGRVAIAVNANDNDKGLAVDRFADFSLPLFGDIHKGCGPLGGIYSGMAYFADKCDVLLVVAGDTPFIPRDLLPRFLDMYREGGEGGWGGFDIVFARSLGRYHPTISLWSMELRGALEEALKRGVRKIDLFTANYKVAMVDFDGERGEGDVFFNVNTAEDLAEAERMHARQ